MTMPTIAAATANAVSRSGATKPTVDEATKEPIARTAVMTNQVIGLRMRRS